MRNITWTFLRQKSSVLKAVRFLVIAVIAANASYAFADEADAKRLFKAMSDYLAAQKVISFDYDTTLQIVTDENQKLGLASSGSVRLHRPDKLYVTRHGGFANVVMVFDGKTLSLLGKNANAFVKIKISGTIDQMVDELRDKYHRPVPAADLLMSNVYDQLIPEVINVKDLGSGVIHGIECDHLAFRTKEVDWEIWIAHGEQPYPCRYVITSPKVSGGPQYIIDIRDWKTGAEAASGDFTLSIPTDAKELKADDLPRIDELPDIFQLKKGA